MSQARQMFRHILVHQNGANMPTGRQVNACECSITAVTTAAAAGSDEKAPSSPPAKPSPGWRARLSEAHERLKESPMDSQTPESLALSPPQTPPKRSSRALEFETPEEVLKARAEKAEAEAAAAQEMAEAKEVAARRCAEVAEEERRAREAADAREVALRQQVGFGVGLGAELARRVG